MSGFFSSLISEIGARRRRLRKSFGDWGQTLSEFLLFVGLFVSSLGLYVRAWMPAAAPWGFALPFLFVAGYLLIDSRRQAALKAGREPEKIALSFDWAALLWSMFCALAGAAAFVIAWSAKPPPPPEPAGWTPPESAVSVDIVP